MNQIKCLFCDKTDLSREHVWPNWICKDLRLNYMHTRIDKVARTVRQKVTNSLTRKCLCVCRGCNGGWMKAIEDATKPVLQPMIHGKHPSLLSCEVQKILARWISLRSIIFNKYAASTAADLYFAEDDRINFRNSNEPLPNTMVLIATALPSVKVNFEPSFFSIRDSDAPKGSGDRFLETTGLLRQFAFQAITFPDKDWLASISIKPNSPIGQIVKKIWPDSIERRWPPTGSLGWSGYESLKGLVGRTIVAHNHLHGERVE